MYHRLRLLDLVIALEAEIREREHLHLIRTFIEYRRVKRTHVRETTDYVAHAEIGENRIVPDAAFILENAETGRRGLFFVEMDMGTERITAPKSADQRATIRGKFEQYDRYLTSGRFAATYKAWGDFRSFTLLFVTTSAERIVNIRAAAADLPARLHGYYRFATFADAITNFLGSIWQTRSIADSLPQALIQPKVE
jgi:Replication-relaxation